MASRKRRAPLRKKRTTLHQYFVPGPHNDHRPEFLEFQALAINVAIVVMLFLIAIGIQSLVFRTPSSQAAAVVAAVLVDLANDDRSLEALPTLSVNPALEKAAQMKAADMAAKSYFAHTSPEGKDPWHWFKEAGYDFSYAGENLAVYFSDSAEVERAWMNSPKHRANILSGKFTEVGIAIAEGSYQGTETTFVVQMFAAPSFAPPSPEATDGRSKASEGKPAASQAVAVAVSTPEADTPVAGASAQRVETVAADETFIAVAREGEAVAAISPSPQPIGAVKDMRKSSFFSKLLTSPKSTLQYIYMTLGGLVLLSLSLLFLSGLRRLHVPSLMRGASLFALIAVLFWSSSYLSGQLLIV